MKNPLIDPISIFVCGSVMAAANAPAQTNHYVWLGGGHQSPYTNWATAAHDIQSAIDASAAGAVIWVTNGVYDTGGRTHQSCRGPDGSGTNRVSIDKSVTVRSVNGPSNTFIVGRWHNPGGVATFTNWCGTNAVRCAYITNGAALIGFTLTNGYTPYQEHEWAFGGGAWAQSTDAVLSNCVISTCAARHTSGGVHRGTLYNCELTGNRITVNAGGGAAYAVLYDCVLTGNWASGFGSGVWRSTLHNCLLKENFVTSTSTFWGDGGGGALLCTLYNCTIMNHTQRRPGAACRSSTLYSCLLMGNQCDNVDGGSQGQGAAAYGCTLYNCVVAGNSAYVGGGTYLCTNVNSIVYYNTANTSPNYFGGTNLYSCAFPLPAGDGNISDAPAFIDPGHDFGTNHVPGNYRLAKGSPCINAGTNFSYMTDPAVLATNRWLGNDLDANPRIQLGTVDMGAYEFIPAGTMFMIRGQ